MHAAKPERLRMINVTVCVYVCSGVVDAGAAHIGVTASATAMRDTRGKETMRMIKWCWMCVYAIVIALHWPHLFVLYGGGRYE